MKIKSSKFIRSANGSWEYHDKDMDDVESQMTDTGVSFTEPLLIADEDGTVYTRAGFNNWLKYLEKEYPNNWYDVYDTYHCDTDEEFIATCSDDTFQHDFGYTLSLYKRGLSELAEDISKEIPSNTPAYPIPNGFAFDLYPEEEEPSGFNSYWVDDIPLNSDSFIWGINPSIGNRFDVIVNPDYLWNGSENINSSKKSKVIKSSKTQDMFDKAILKAAELVKKANEEEIYDNAGNIKLNDELDNITVKLIDLPFDFNLEPQELKSYIKKLVPENYFSDKRCWSYLYDIVFDDIYKNIGFNINSNRRTNMKIMRPIKSGKYIKSGTSNFADNRASADFPLVVFDGTAYIVDEETGEETDERDYDAESWYYEDAYDEAKSLADEMGIELSDFDIHRMRYDSRDAGYDQPFFVGIGGGYYDGMQIFTDDNLYFDPEEIANDEGLLDDFEYAEDQADYDRVVKEVEERITKEWETKINEYLNKLCSEYGWMKIGVTARFSNGETWYNRIDNSRKSIKSMARGYLKPEYDSRASFYNKAETEDDKLYSYGTLVAEIINGEPVLYPDWSYSQTTIRHVREWLKQHGFEAGSKAEIERMYNIQSSRKPIKSGYSQKQLKDMARDGIATDITSWSQEQIMEIKPLTKIAVSKGTYGMNGALLKDDNGNLYVITARNSNLFFCC